MSKEKRRFSEKKIVINSLKVLEATISTLNKYKIDYYLDYGTLIGAMREKAFIPWDDDMDISLVVNEDNYAKIPNVLEDIKKLGFRTYITTFDESINKRIFNEQKDSTKIVHTKEINFTSQHNYRVAKVRNNKFWKFGRGGSTLDIFFKYEDNKNLYWMAQGKAHNLPKKNLGTEFIDIDFYHLKCKVPENYDEYLTSMYGDWKIPKEDWQYYEHDTCTLKD